MRLSGRAAAASATRTRLRGLGSIVSTTEGILRLTERPASGDGARQRVVGGEPSLSPSHFLCVAHTAQMDQQLSFDPLLDLEQQFYQRGFDAGRPHGELHGLFEGRELGRDKAWELCEEVGYYEGMARLWKGILEAQGKDSGRCVRALASSRLVSGGELQDTAQSRRFLLPCSARSN